MNALGISPEAAIAHGRRLLAEGAKGAETPFHPINILNTYVWKPPFVPPRIGDILDSALAQHTGPNSYPGDAKPSPNWPPKPAFL